MDYHKSPGISFNAVFGRIIILKQTLVAMGYPEYYRFLFDPENRFFGIEPCSIDDGGSHRLPSDLIREYHEIKCMDLVRFVYKTCGWQKKLTYRISGKADGKLIYFDLQKAEIVNERKAMEAEGNPGDFIARVL